MKGPRVSRTDEELIEILADMFEDVGLEETEEVDSALQELGYDPEELVRHMRTVIQNALENSPLNWRNQ